MGKHSRRMLAETSQKGTALAATLFLAPALILIALYMIYPVIDTFVTSQYQWNGISADRIFIGLDNWKTLLQDSKFWASFSHNLVVMVFSILLQIPLGLLLATFLDSVGRKSNIFKIIWFFPYLMSSVAIAFLFNYILGTNDGLFTSIATLLNGKRTIVDLLGKSPQALFAVIGVMAWQFTPFYMVYFIAGYSNISTSLYEAAIIDGANRRQYLFKIAIPLLGPIFKTACTMSMHHVDDRLPEVLRYDLEHDSGRPRRRHRVDGDLYVQAVLPAVEDGLRLRRGRRHVHTDHRHRAAVPEGIRRKGGLLT